MSTREEVIAASTDYFAGDMLAAKSFTEKYALCDDEEFFELIPADMHQRMAKEFARADMAYPNYLDEETFFDWLSDWSVVPGGSIMAGLGNPYTTASLSNCFSLVGPDDSISGIGTKVTELMNISKRRGGVGFELSTLRPENARVSNSAKTSSGAVSWAKFFSAAGEVIGQRGRRGAFLFLFDARHPDIMKFINCKQNTADIPSANISVKITDEFMAAVKADADWDLVWKDKVWATVKATKIWDMIAKAAWKTGEPGVLFWDNYANSVPTHFYKGFECVACNPCLPWNTRVIVKVGDKPRSKNLADLEVGEQIWSKEGWTNVVAKYDRGIKPVYGYETEHGAFRATKEHKVICNGECVEVGKATHLETCQEFPQGWPVLDELRLENEPILSSKLLNDMQVYDITVDNSSHTFVNCGFNVSNCGELLLPNRGACNLGSLNLKKFVNNMFTPEADFDFDRLKAAVRMGVRILDDLVDLEAEAVSKIIAACTDDLERNLFTEIREVALQVRRTGLGTHGLADALACLGIKYDSEEGLYMAEYIYTTLRNEAYRTSIELAKERGAFPAFNMESDDLCPFIHTLPQDIQDDMKKYGRRNGALLTSAPTGTISLLCKTSSGMEPVFANSYYRSKKINDPNQVADYVDANGVKWEKYKVFHHNVQEFLSMFPEYTEDTLPPYFVTSADIDWTYRLKIQAVISRLSDGGVSATVNLPKDTPWETIRDIYMTAYDMKIKGVTVYRDGCRDGVLNLTNSLVKTDHFKRPDMLPCDIYHAVVKEGDLRVPYVVIVGLKDGQPFEVFGGKADEELLAKKQKHGEITKHRHRKTNRYELVSNGTTICNLGEAFSASEYSVSNRLMSLALRNGCGVNFLIDQLMSEPDSDMNAYNRVVSRCLKNYVEDGAKSGATCPQCGAKSLRYQDKCSMCMDCGYSGCG